MAKRLFVAIKPDAELIENIIHWQKKHKKLPAVRMIKPEYLHLTLVPPFYEDDEKRINEHKENPAILCWEIADEPAYTWNSAEPRIKPEPMKKTYDFIKQLDNEHLIFTNHAPVNLISTMQAYNNSTDIVAVDVYPVVPHGITPTYALLQDGM